MSTTEKKEQNTITGEEANSPENNPENKAEQVEQSGVNTQEKPEAQSDTVQKDSPASEDSNDSEIQGQGKEQEQETASEQATEEESDEETEPEADAETMQQADSEASTAAEEDDGAEGEEGAEQPNDDEPVAQQETAEADAEDNTETEAEAEEEVPESAVFYKELAEKAERVADESDWSYASVELDNIENQWKEGPSEEEQTEEEPPKELLKKYKARIESARDKFEERRRAHYDKINKQKQENLERKKKLLADLEEIVNKEKWQARKQVNKIQSQWDSLKPVPKEENAELEKQFQKLIDTFESHKVDYLVKKAEKEEENLAGKLLVLDKMEKLVESITDESTDWDQVNRTFKNLEKQWKKIGRVPKDKNQDLWDRYNAAQQAFYDKKFKFDAKLRNQEEENLEEKKELIEEAKQIQDTTDWKEGANKMQKLMEEWKEIGPVPRKESQKIWKEFKGAMDVFYERRREHFREKRKEEKENLQKKRDILEKLRELGQAEDPIEAVEEAKKWQAEFKKIGYVPIKQKNKVWKQYREACDVIYDRFRAAKGEQQTDKSLAKQGVDKQDRSKIKNKRNEINRVKREVNQLEEEIIQFKESKTFFKPTNKGNKVLEEIEEKIQKAEKKLSDKQDYMDQLSQEIEDLKSDDDE